jgi:type IV pilus assembly protein PilM
MFTDSIIVGLDIGSESIKMVEVEHTKEAKTLRTYGLVKHNLQLEGYWDSTRLRQVASLIEEVMNQAHFSGVKTVMSVMSKDVYVTTMDFELTWNRKQIDAEVKKQAPYFLPYPPEEMRVSWTVIKDDPRIQSYTGKQRVIINALPDFVIENSKNLLEHVNLDGIALENQTLSQIRSTLQPDKGNSVLVDIGSHQTSFSIIVDGVLRSSSHIPHGASEVTKKIAEGLGVDDESADHFKYDINLVNLYDLPDAISDALRTWRVELQTFVDLNRKVAQDPAKVIITGGGASTPGLIESMQSFPIPVFLANSMRQIKVTKEYQPYIIPIANQLSTAIGLAIRTDMK